MCNAEGKIKQNPKCADIQGDTRLNYDGKVVRNIKRKTKYQLYGQKDDVINYLKEMKIRLYTTYILIIQDRNISEKLLGRPKHSTNEVVAPKKKKENQLYNEHYTIIIVILSWPKLLIVKSLVNQLI